MHFHNLGFNLRFSARREWDSSRIQDYLFTFDRRSIGEGSDRSSLSDANSILVEFTTGKETWIGRFETGSEGLSGIYATPSPESACVVAEGSGYWVPTLHPDAYNVVRCTPIKEVLRVPERDIIIFADYTRMSAYGINGLLWTTERLSWDGLQITHVSRSSILGLAWDAPADRHVEFSIDTSTGVSAGGSSPEWDLNA
jgi:hypothetical protein